MAQKTEFKEGDKIIASLKAMSDPKKAGKLANRTGLSPEELVQPMHVIHARGGQAAIKHPLLEKAFTAHVKFFERVPAAAHPQ